MGVIMRYILTLAAVSLLACSPSRGSETGSPETRKLKLLAAQGSSAAECRYIAENMDIDLEKLSKEDLNVLASNETILVAGTGDTAFECVTGAVGRLNDLGIDADYEEKAWKHLASVKLGNDKLAHDLAGDSGHPESKPFDKSRNASADVDFALEQAATSGNNLIIVMGANWCHDSRALSGWFASPRFARMLAKDYELVFVDVGYKDRNLDIAEGFGIKSIKGTPTVLVVSPEAQLLNPKSAPTWRNAASRKEDAIFNYFANFEPEI